MAPGPNLEAAWQQFYNRFFATIRKYAYSCGAIAEDVPDCVQEVWAELLVRLPTFRLDPQRGKFDSWLFRIVRGKVTDLQRAHKRRRTRDDLDSLSAVPDKGPSPGYVTEANEFSALALNRLRQRLSKCSFQVLCLRLVDQKPVAEVAQELGLSNQQVWYRYHRARREAQLIGSTWTRGQGSLAIQENPSLEKKKNEQNSAQGTEAISVSRNIGPSSHACHGGNCVDYVFQKLELGRRELNPEWKVEWDCDGVPKPVLYIRKTAIVAYAEICGPAETVNAHWPRIVNAAITAGVSAGIATIIATPSAALPIFQTEFQKHMQAKGGNGTDSKIQVALSAKQEANGPWCGCRE